MDVALENQYARIVYVDYNSLAGGPLGLLAQGHVSTILRILYPADILASKLALGVLLWRVRVVYSGTRFAISIIIVASLFYLAYVVSDILQLVLTWTPEAMAPPTITRTLSIVVIVLTETSKIIMTFMIITRLILIRQKHIKLMGKTDVAAQYLGIAAMLIESYALSTTWNTGFLIAYILKNPGHDFFGRSCIQVEILTYFLVLYRVFSGRAWDRQTQNQLSTLRWNHRSTQASEG